MVGATRRSTSVWHKTIHSFSIDFDDLYDGSLSQEIDIHSLFGSSAFHAPHILRSDQDVDQPQSRRRSIEYMACKVITRLANPSRAEFIVSITTVFKYETPLCNAMEMGLRWVLSRSEYGNVHWHNAWTVS